MKQKEIATVQQQSKQSLIFLLLFQFIIIMSIVLAMVLGAFLVGFFFLGGLQGECVFRKILMISHTSKCLSGAWTISCAQASISC